jgi:hypothetical protein
VSGLQFGEELLECGLVGATNESAAGAVATVSSSCAVAACAGGRCVQTTTDGSSWRKGWSEPETLSGPRMSPMGYRRSPRVAVPQVGPRRAAPQCPPCPLGPPTPQGEPKQSDAKQVPVRWL